MMKKKFKKDLLEKFNELYFFEFQRKDSINSGSNFLLALFTIYGSVLVFYFNSLPIFEASITSISFYLLLLFSLIFFTLSIIHFNKFTSGRNYQYFSYPDEILDYLNSLIEYNKEAEIEQEIDLSDEFYDFMLDQSAKSVKINSMANNNKILSYNNTVRFLHISLLLLIITSIPFFLDNYQGGNISEETTTTINLNGDNNGKTGSEAKEAGAPEASVSQ